MKYELTPLASRVFETPADASHWFGYYNYSPLNQEGNRLLAHRVDFDGRAILPDDVAEVGWFDFPDGGWHPIGKTHAINWQQGAMLQWIGPDFNQRVVYNDAENGRFVSRIFDVSSGVSRTLPWPVYGVTSSGEKAISLQFERSYWCRAYHYESLANPEWNVPIPEGDGIFSVDMNSGEVRRIIALADVVRLEPLDDFPSQSHWLEHVMLNPSGTRFAFYHRFGKGYEFRTRVLTADLDGKNIFLHPGWRDSQYSHLGWKNDIELVLFAYKQAAVGRIHAAADKPNSIGGFVLNIYRKYVKAWMPKRASAKLMVNTYYQCIRDQQGPTGKYDRGLLSRDGHPSFTSDGAFMLTDTYADQDGYRHLLLFDIQHDRLYELGRFFSPFNNCGHRCDLHPRLSRDEQFVIIDTAHTGRHQMMVIKINWNEIRT